MIGKQSMCIRTYVHMYVHKCALPLLGSIHAEYIPLYSEWFIIHVGVDTCLFVLMRV